MKNLAIIPARSGSKGIKDKNLALLHGKPMMAYSIEAAIKSECFDEVMCSTDSERYAEIALEYGASIPFLRSAATSGDHAGSWEVVYEVLNNYNGGGKVFDSVCLLQPTSPMRNADDIRKAYSIKQQKKAQTVVSVCEMEHSPLWCNTLPFDLCMDDFFGRDVSGNRHENPVFYRLNGAIYIVDTDLILKSGPQVTDYDIYNNSYAYVMPTDRSMDIDSLIDLKMVDFLMGL